MTIILKKMDKILKKRIEEAAITGSKHYDPNISKYSQGKQVGYIRGFKEGAEYALSHQWISVEDALPEYDETVIVDFGDDDYALSHRSNNPDVLTDINGFCNYGYKEILAWLPIPKFEPKK